MSDNTEFEADYPDVVTHLHKLEKWNRWHLAPLPLTPQDIYTHPIFVDALKKTGVYRLAKRLYYKIR
jgi:hypothetical protein